MSLEPRPAKMDQSRRRLPATKRIHRSSDCNHNWCWWVITCWKMVTSTVFSRRKTICFKPALREAVIQGSRSNGGTVGASWRHFRVRLWLGSCFSRSLWGNLEQFRSRANQMGRMSANADKKKKKRMSGIEKYNLFHHHASRIGVHLRASHKYVIIESTKPPPSRWAKSKMES